MEAVDPVVTPMRSKTKLPDQNVSQSMQRKYHSMIGALMYLTSSRPDIVHATCLCAPYRLSNRRKRLKDMRTMRDAKHLQDTSVELRFLGEKLYSWSSKKQDLCASTAASKYVVSIPFAVPNPFGMRTQSLNKLHNWYQSSLNEDWPKICNTARPVNTVRSSNTDGCINSGEVRVQQRKRIIQRRVQQKQKDQEDEVFGRILSAKKMKSYYCWFKITAVGEKVNAAESLLVVSTEVNAN
ncbi:hypothetical protein Tco_0484860 [Tanacetum coccineum]